MLPKLLFVQQKIDDRHAKVLMPFAAVQGLSPVVEQSSKQLL